MSECVSILGSAWRIEYRDENTDPLLATRLGYEDHTARLIVIRKPPMGTDAENPETLRREVVRHETIHAFLDECGLANSSEWAVNDEMVDWFAKVSPKIFKAWKELGVLFDEVME